MPDATEGPTELTEYAELHGCSCKLGRSELDSLLTEVDITTPQPELICGVGEDASARPIGDDQVLVSTIDFFTPIVDDPYQFGRIAACNAASDAFAMGAWTDLSLLVVLGLPRTATDIATALLSGIIDAVDEMGGVVAGGHTIMNPWPIAGGAVTATTAESSLLQTTTASPGERLYLTKPLGTQPAMGALRVKDGEFGETVTDTTDRPIETIGEEALAWMTTPNRDAIEAGHEFVTAATDVTGFGLLGQSKLLAENAGVGVSLTHLPIIEGALELSRLFGYGLESAESAETSGGLLLTVPEAESSAFEASLSAADVFYREVGTVTEGTGVELRDPTLEAISR